MKKFCPFVLILVLMFSLAGCGSGAAKRDVFRLVERNFDAILEACENRDTEALLAIDGITTVKMTDGYVVVYCKGAGIAPSSQDYGFYYSKEDLPVAVGCNQDVLCETWELVPEGNGYQYISADHNYFYTEHIKGNIYFYSNAY